MDTNTNIKLDAYTAVGIIEGFIESNSEKEIIAAWQYIYDYNLWQVIRKTVNDLLKQGIIKSKS